VPKRFGVREALPPERGPEVDGLYEVVVDEVDAEAVIRKRCINSREKTCANLSQLHCLPWIWTRRDQSLSVEWERLEQLSVFLIRFKINN